MKKSMKVNEESLLKALDTLEGAAGSVRKGEQKLPKSTKEADGGLSGQGGEGEEADVSVSGDEEDPTSHKSLTEDEDEFAKADDEESSDEEGPTDDDGEEDESSSDDETPVKKGKTTKKSLAKSFSEDEVVASQIEVSDFLEHLVDQTSESVDGLAKGIGALSAHQTKFNGMVAKALTLIGNRLNEIQASLDEQGEQPAGGPRSQMTKSLKAGSVEAPAPRFEGEDGPEFSKSDVLDVLVGLAKENAVHPAIVSQYEVSTTMPPEVQRLVEAKLSRRG